MMMCVGGSGPMAIAHRIIKIRATLPALKTNRLWKIRICMAGPPMTRFSSMNLARLRENCESVFEWGRLTNVLLAGTTIGRGGLNIACWPLSKFQPMRLSIFALCLALSTSFAAQPEVVSSDAGPLNPAAAEAGKDVVHQLNNAFAKVFETVAPGVVIIETSKKS